MKLLYFSWVKSKIGRAAEEIALPEGVRDVAGLVAWLGTRGPGYADAFAAPAAIKVAVNRRFACPADPVGPEDEVGLFPPVTGG
jgi:molybdopterin synthase sulfur carrier subunit